MTTLDAVHARLEEIATTASTAAEALDGATVDFLWARRATDTGPG